jgi:hypothetical protein
VLVGGVVAAVVVVYIYPLFSGPAAPYLSTDEYCSDGDQFQVGSICTKTYVTGDCIYDDGGPMSLI